MKSANSSENSSSDSSRRARSLPRSSSLKCSSSLPRIALTIGDPAGVGPEICLKAIADPGVLEICQPILFGDAVVLRQVADRLQLDFSCPEVPVGNWDDARKTTGPFLLDFGLLASGQFQAGVVNAATGGASFRYFDQAITLALTGEIDGIATGPISKEALHLAGYKYPGHTEILAERSQTDDFCMMLTSEIISCAFATTHVGFYEVPDLITQERILKTIRLTNEALTRIRGRKVKLVCCGLNPHAGESGLFGRGEEVNLILPAIEMARSEGIDIEGPVPADTAFVTRKRQTTDGYICMYHDQGGIPLKALAFDEAVNVTLGLPFVRTSVDHGTACDLAWQGVANHQSMVEAIKLAVRLAKD